MATLLGEQLNSFDLETIPGITGRKYQPGGMTGLRLVYSSATAVLLEAGACRDSTDAYDLTLAAQVTLTITAQGALGLDEVTLAATATTNGTAAVTMSASLWSETAMAAVVRTLTGTLTSSGTTVTGSGTKFLSEVAVGDVIRSASNGSSRVTAIASDTSLTIAAAFPGGDVGAAQAITLYENLTLWPDTASSGDKRRVNTVSHAGTAVVLSSSVTSSGSGKTARIGVEVASCLLRTFVRYGTGTTGQISTQRTRPYPLSGYDTAWRYTGALTNKSNGDICKFSSVNFGATRHCTYDDSGNDARVLSAGTSTSFVDVDVSVFVPDALAWLRVLPNYVSAVVTMFVRTNGSSAAGGTIACNGIVNSGPSSYAPITILGGAVEYALSGAGTDAYIDVLGYTEVV